MDLKQPISFGSGGKSAKKPLYPTKTSINLVDVEATRGNLAVQLALFLVVLVLIGIFAKFAVVDPLAESMGSSAEVAAAQAQLAALEEENANYAELNERYARYVVTGLTEDEQVLIDRDTVIDLLEQKVMGVGHVSSLKVSGNVAVATSLGADLNQVSKLVEDLETDERVAHVTVSTAQGENDSGTSATIQITFKGTLDEADQAAVDALMSEAMGEEAGNDAA